MREEFIVAVARLLGIRDINSVERDFIDKTTLWIKSDMYNEFFATLSRVDMKFLKPIEIVSIAVKKYEDKKFGFLYNDIENKAYRIVKKLKTAFAVIKDESNMQIEFQKIMVKNKDTGKIERLFTLKELNVLKNTKRFEHLYNKRNDTYSLTNEIEWAYEKTVQSFIRSKIGDTKRLENKPIRMDLKIKRMRYENKYTLQ